MLSLCNLQLREQKLMGELAAEQKKEKAQQRQLEALKSALEDIKVMHAEELSSQQADSARHLQGEMERIKVEHDAEVKRLKGMIKLAGQTTSSIGNKVSRSRTTDLHGLCQSLSIASNNGRQRC